MTQQDNYDFCKIDKFRQRLLTESKGLKQAYSWWKSSLCYFSGFSIQWGYLNSSKDILDSAKILN